MDMTQDAIREALASLNDAYQEVLQAEFPADQQAAVVNSLGNAMEEVEDALRFAGVVED